MLCFVNISRFHLFNSYYFNGTASDSPFSIVFIHCVSYFLHNLLLCSQQSDGFFPVKPYINSIVSKFPSVLYNYQRSDCLKVYDNSLKKHQTMSSKIQKDYLTAYLIAEVGILSGCEDGELTGMLESQEQVIDSLQG